MGEGAKAITITLRLPKHCPEPPKIPKDEIFEACVLSGQMASAISRQFATLDGKVMDHQIAQHLKNRNYQMLGTMSTCSNGKKFPCDEDILSMPMPIEHKTLQCLNTNEYMAQMTMDFACFRGSLRKSWYDEYIYLIETMVQKWVKILSEQVFPGTRCLKWGIASSNKQWDSQDQFKA